MSYSVLPPEYEHQLRKVYPKTKDPIAVTFTPNTSIASWFSGSGSLELEKQDVTPEFIAYHAVTVRERRWESDDSWRELSATDREDVQAAFANTIAPLNKTLTTRLGHDPIYKVLILPSVFGRLVSLAILAALRDAGFGFSNAYTAFDAMCSGWDFYKGENLGRPADQCGRDGPEDMVLALEYENEYLFVHQIHVEYSFKPMFVEGESKLSTTLGYRHTDVEDRLNHRLALSTFVKNFLNGKALPHDVRERIRAIVVAGEVPAQGATELGAIVQEVIGGDVVQVLTDDTDPTRVTARGAAELARYLGQAYRMGICSRTYLTDEEYEKGLEIWEYHENKRKERENKEQEQVKEE